MLKSDYRGFHERCSKPVKEADLGLFLTGRAGTSWHGRHLGWHNVFIDFLR
jgi:hypothetical protein